MAESRDKKARLPTARRRNPDRRFTLENRWVAGSLVTFFFVAMLAVLAYEFGTFAPELTEEDIGTIATQDYRATKDFTFSRIDHEATERLRQEKASSVPPIYRWDVAVAETSRRRIREAFAFMREGIEKVREREELTRRGLLPPINVRPPPPSEFHTTNVWEWSAAVGLSGLAGTGFGPDDNKDDRSDAERLNEAIESWAQVNRAEFDNRLLEYVEADTYAMLVKQGFGEHVEQDLLELVESVLEKPIMADIRDLGDVEAVKIQKRRGDQQLESWVETNLATILDRESALRNVDEQSRLRLSQWSPSDRLKISILAKHFVQPNLTLDVERTAKAREAALEQESKLEVRQEQEFQAGQIIIDEGHKVTREHVEIYNAMTDKSPPAVQLWSVVGLGVFLLLMLLLVWFLIRRGTGRHRRPRDTAFFAATLLVMLFVLRLLAEIVLTVSSAWQVEIGQLIVLCLPFAAGSLMLRLVQDGEVALIFAVVLALLAGLVLPLPVVVVPYAAISGIIGTVALRRAKTRMSVLRAGLLVGAISGVCAVGLFMFEANELRPWLLGWIFALSVVGGVLAAILVTVGLPIVESVFGYTTDIKLLELANLEHPALKELLLNAPGTYHHSMMVGSLNEAAAEAIGANALLCRVGAYYHDIGKMKNAQYFAENQRGENAHDKLKPNMSALILKAHVKDGIEMARSYKLPKDLIDFIATHHGTSRIEFFYQKAKRAESPDIPEVREEDYRYPGPKPQSRETGICMIADTVEAAARALPEKTPARLRLLVQKLINHKFADGQFDECDLTLRDLNAIAEAMLHILNAVYHHRPEYPDSKKKKNKDDDKGKSSKSSDKTKVDEPEISEVADTVPQPAVKAKDGNGRASVSRVSPLEADLVSDDEEDDEEGSADVTETIDDVLDTPHPGIASPLTGPVFDGPDPDAPVGRPRTDRSSSGEHRKIDLPKGHG